VRPRILVVDDEQLIIDNLLAFLEDEGMHAEGVASAEEALERIESGRPYHICIMDMRLPGMDGDTAIRTLHRRCGSSSRRGRRTVSSRLTSSP
jgi:two-component system OmpR family response regulator